ncbi:MAG: 4Fe-4S dicluster domain-containing protein [Bacteroidales bacterium]|jgi:polyferredoxin|nr:4Fe-4S dicluster domain-containing protein [Bacteroidales bacterium]
MLKILRVIISIIIFILITFYFLDFSGILPYQLHGLMQIQFIPALLMINIIALVCITVITLLFGRIYCSVICPMGVFQDVVSRISKFINLRKSPNRYRKSKNILRWSIVGSAFILFCLGYTVVLGTVDPYSAYGRIVVHLFKPLYLLGNNLLAVIFNSFGSYIFYRIEIVMLSFYSFMTAILTLFLVGILAWTNGRFYCNTICPVGTVLGFISRFSLFKVQINADKCNHCGLCTKGCKSSCIDSKSGKIDYSCCVDCFNCINICHRKCLSFAISLNKKRQKNSLPSEIDRQKRQFLLSGLSTVIAIPVAWAQETTTMLKGKKRTVRETAISPPGAISADHLLKHCSSCHLCIAKCPSNVLKPAFMEYGVGGIMQPIMYFEKGFCNFDCTVCSNICPNGALKSLSVEEKHLMQVGRVVFDEDVCIVYTEGTNCGACSEHCPTQAVKMIPYKDGLTIPYIDPDICVGCGGCEFICPTRPYRAIHIEGNKIQQQAKAFTIEQTNEKEITDFGF